MFFINNNTEKITLNFLKIPLLYKSKKLLDDLSVGLGHSQGQK